MKKLLLALALTLFASSSMSADFITVHEVYRSDATHNEMIISVDNIYRIDPWNSPTYYPSAKSKITFNFGSGLNNLMPYTYVSETKEEIKSWINMKN